MKHTITINQIIALVADYFQLSVEQVTGKCRKQQLVKARQIVMYLSYQYMSTTLVMIGKAFNCDHTTVIHSMRIVKNSIDIKDNYIYPHMEHLQHKIRQMKSYRPKFKCLTCIISEPKALLQTLFTPNNPQIA